MDAHPSELMAANSAFYEAINGRNLEAMDELWARDAPVACIHPGWDALEGRDSVIASWRAILSSPEAPRILCSDASPHVYADAAFVVCVETIDVSALIATNVFVRERGAWRVVHHHAGPIARRPSTQRTSRPPPRDLN